MIKYQVYLLKEWRAKHPNNINAKVGCENILMPEMKSKTVFETVINEKGVKEILTKRVEMVLHAHPDKFVKIKGKWSLRNNGNL